MPTISAIVPATNDPPTLERCLAAIAAARPDETIVVTRPHGTGPAEARNTGASQAAGDVLVFVDADVIVHRDAFDRLRRRLDRDPSLVAVFGSYDDTVATTTIVAGYRNLQHHVVHGRSAGMVESFWAGLGAVRAAAFREAGGFDAVRYPVPSIEDIELGGRLARIGPIAVDPTVQGTHVKEWTLWTMVATDFSRRGIPWVRLMLERRAVPRTLNLGTRERASVLAAVTTAVGVVLRRPSAVTAGVVAQIALNHDLYTTLHRRLGLRGATSGVVLHTLHELTAVAAVPAGIAAELVAQVTSSRSSSTSTSGPSSR